MQPSTQLIPAIIPKTLNEIENKVAQIKGLASFVQLDITDGVLAGEKSWPLTSNAKDELVTIMAEEEGMPYWDEIDYELDLMVTPSNMDFELFMKLGPSRVVFHTKDEKVLEDYLMKTPRGTVQVGLAFDITDTVEILSPLFEKIDFVQCMGIAKDGFQGAPFDERVLANITAIKEAYPDMPISVDGGVNEETIPKLLQAGATRLVVGSAVFHTDDPSESYTKLAQMLPIEVVEE